MDENFTGEYRCNKCGCDNIDAYFCTKEDCPDRPDEYPEENDDEPTK
jgi:hypothetical protein